MKNRRQPAIAVRLHVDAHGLTHWELYERASGAVLMRLRTSPQALRRVFETIREVA